MNSFVHDPEVDQLRRLVSCPPILEHAGWQLDPAESTRRAAKYRRGRAEILIFSHDDKRGPTSLGEEKGHCLVVVQSPDPGLHFGLFRKLLRQTASVAPSRQRGHSGRHTEHTWPDMAPVLRWQPKAALRPSTPARKYLAEERGLPEAVLRNASTEDCVRAIGYGSTRFDHGDDANQLTCIEARGPTYRGVLLGGAKSLFRFRPNHDGEVARLAVRLAPSNALSLATVERGRGDKLHVATAGGMGPGSIDSLCRALTDLAWIKGAPVIATDADPPGDRHAAQLRSLVGKHLITVERILPPGGLNDWNDVLKSGRRAR